MVGSYQDEGRPRRPPASNLCSGCSAGDAYTGSRHQACIATTLFGNDSRLTNEALVWGKIVREMTELPIFLLLTADVSTGVDTLARTIGLHTLRVEDPPVDSCARDSLSWRHNRSTGAVTTRLARPAIRWRLLTNFAPFYRLEGMCRSVLSLGVDVLPTSALRTAR